MKVFYYFLVSLFVVALVACNGKKSNEAEEPQGLPVFHFEQQDSTAIRELAKDYVDRFNSGDAEGAAGMLHIIRNDSVLPLSGDQRQMMVEQIKLFSKFGCEQKELQLFSDRDNVLRIAVKVVESGNLETGAGTTNMFLNPIQKDGQWYLTLRDTHAEGVGVYHKE